MKSANCLAAAMPVALVGLAVLTTNIIHSTGTAAQPPELLEEAIVESGTVESADVLQILCEVPGESVILQLVPDGTNVKKGDLLVQLDDSALRESLAIQKVRARNDAAALAAARAELESATQSKSAAVAIAEQELLVAELARKRMLGEGGELDHRLDTIERKTIVVEQQLAAREKLGAAAEVRELQGQLETARGEKRLLQEFIRPHETAIHNLEIQKAKRELERTLEDTQTAVVEATATVAARTRQLELARTELKHLEQSIAACTIVAPRDGVVMHASPPGRRSTSSTLEAGATVRELQPLLEMPDLERPMARILVHESQIDRVKVGQPALLQVEALGKREIAGRVARISRTPQPQNWLNPGVVEYAVIVEIPEPPAGLRIGMTVAARIETGPEESR